MRLSVRNGRLPRRAARGAEGGVGAGARRGRARGARRRGGRLGFRAAKKHLSVFPFSPAAVDAVKDRLEGFDLSKGTIRFTPDQPVPDDVLADLVRARKAEIESKR